MGQCSTADMSQEWRIQTWDPKQELNQGKSMVTSCIWQLPLAALSFFFHFEVSKVSFELLGQRKHKIAQKLDFSVGEGLLSERPYFKGC